MGLNKYRKYGSVIDILSTEAAMGTLSHALIIEGSSLIDKFGIAKELLKAQMCRIDPGNGCDCCDLCRRVDHDNFEDLFVLPLDSTRKTKGYRVEQIRKDLLPFLERKGSSKENMVIAVIPYADLLSPEAQDTILKTLEEPKENRQIILLSDNADSLQKTIKSRCRIYRINSLGDEYENPAMDDARNFVEMIKDNCDFYKMIKLLDNHKDKEQALLFIDALEVLVRNDLIKWATSGGTGAFMSRSVGANAPYIAEKLIMNLEETRRDILHDVKVQYALRRLYLIYKMEVL